MHKSDSQNVPLLQMKREDLRLPLNRTPLCFTTVLYNSAFRQCRAVLVLFHGPALALRVALQAGSITCSTVTVLRNLPVHFAAGLEKGVMTPLLASLARAGIRFYPHVFFNSEGKKIPPREELFFLQWDAPKPFSSCITVGIVRTTAVITFWR